MTMEVETITMLLLGFVAIIVFSLVVIISLWVKVKSKSFGWFLAQIVLLIAAFIMFLKFLIIPPSIPNTMISEENSLNLGIIGVLWACSMLCMLMGIYRLSKQKLKGEELDKEKKEYNPSIKNSIGMLLFYALLCPIVPMILTAVAAHFIGFSEEDPLVYVVTTIAQLVLLILWLKRKYIIDLKGMFSTKKVSAMFFIPMTIIMTGSGILLSEVDNFMRRIIPISDFWIKIFSSLLGDGFAPWKGIIAVVVIAPIVEEIIFRGLILKGFLKHYSVKKSIIISALLFGIIHMNPWQFVSALVGGTILGWWYVKTDSILVSIFGHALNNGMSFIVGAIGLSIPGYNAALDIAKHQPIWFDLLGVALLAAGVVWLTKLFNSRQAKSESDAVEIEVGNAEV